MLSLLFEGLELCGLGLRGGVRGGGGGPLGLGMGLGAGGKGGIWEDFVIYHHIPH